MEDVSMDRPSHSLLPLCKLLPHSLPQISLPPTPFPLLVAHPFIRRPPLSNDILPIDIPFLEPRPAIPTHRLTPQLLHTNPKPQRASTPTRTPFYPLHTHPSPRRNLPILNPPLSTPFRDKSLPQRRLSPGQTGLVQEPCFTEFTLQYRPQVAVAAAGTAAVTALQRFITPLHQLPPSRRLRSPRLHATGIRFVGIVI